MIRKQYYFVFFFQVQNEERGKGGKKSAARLSVEAAPINELHQNKKVSLSSPQKKKGGGLFNGAFER